MPDQVSGWREMFHVPTLELLEIHVWRINLIEVAAEDSPLPGCLSSKERERAARFHFARDRRRFIIRRMVLRQLLGECLNIKPEDVRLAYGPRGKPMIESDSDLRFSCSHSGDMALIALARNREVGVDLEEHRRLTDVMDLADSFFSPLEIAQLTSLPPALKTAGFFDCWTRKEAFIKATGLGLSFPLNRFAVSLTPNRPAALLLVENDPSAVDHWRMISLTADSNYSATLAYDGNPAEVRFFQWNSQG